MVISWDPVSSRLGIDTVRLEEMTIKGQIKLTLPFDNVLLFFFCASCNNIILLL